MAMRAVFSKGGEEGGGGGGVICRSLEKRAWLVGRFFLLSVARLSFDRLERHLDRRRKEVETVLRLSKDGLSWGDRGQSSWRPRLWNRTLPFEFVELFALQSVFQEDSKPEMLICVARSKHSRDFNYEVFAFRLYDQDDVRRFQRLFRSLTTGTGSAPGPTLSRDGAAPVVERRVLRHLVDGNSGHLVTGYGDRIRRGARKVGRAGLEPASVIDRDRNNNVNGHRNRAGNQSGVNTEENQTGTERNNRTGNQSAVMLVAQGNSDPEDGLGRDLNGQRIKPVPSPRKSILPERARTVESDSVSSECMEGQSRHPEMDDSEEGPKRDEVSDRESDTSKDTDLIWTPNLAFCHDTAEDRDLPVALKFDSDDEDIFEIPTNETESRSRDTGEVKVDFRGDDLETASDAHRYVTMTSEEDFSDGRVSVIVPDYTQVDDVIEDDDRTQRNDDVIRQDGVRPKSLLKVNSGLETEAEVGKRKKTLSFSPSVVTIKGTLGRPEVPEVPGMTVTVHRIFRRDRSSLTDSVDSSNDTASPDRRRARPVLERGISLPVDAISGPSVTSDRNLIAPDGAANKEFSARGQKVRREPAIINICHQMADTRSPEVARHDSKYGNSNMTSHPRTIASVSCPDEGDSGKLWSPDGKPPVSGRDSASGSGGPRRRWWNFWRRSRDPPLLYVSEDDEQRKNSEVVGHRRLVKASSVPIHSTRETSPGPPRKSSPGTDLDLSADTDVAGSKNRKDGRTREEDLGERTGQDRREEREQERAKERRISEGNAEIGRKMTRQEAFDHPLHHHRFIPVLPPAVTRDRHVTKYTVMRSSRRHLSVTNTDKVTLWSPADPSHPGTGSNGLSAFTETYLRDKGHPIALVPAQMVSHPSTDHQNNGGGNYIMVQNSTRPQISKTSNFRQRHSYFR